MNKSAFGSYIRKKRAAAGLSLRKVADKMGISHVYLGEVERGIRGPFERKHWDDLISSIPGVEFEELERLAANDRPVQLNLADAPPRYKELGLVLARRIQEQDLPNSELEKLIKILRGEKS
jgi:transcriptional regulator with XRE-family HTH domain